MKSSLSFLIAAKRCEMADLQQLERTSELVQVTSRLIHALQRERGLSNLYLGSRGERLSNALLAQMQATQAVEAEWRAHFDTLNLETERQANGARLFSRIAYVMQGLDALTHLRSEVLNLNSQLHRATAAYVRLVAGLLAVVFEAADTATDPSISRLLVALFNFMQGKESAGQERAVGVAMLTSGMTHHEEQQRLLHLIESQERCLKVFREFASPATEAMWRDHEQASSLAELERYRRILCTRPSGTPLDTALGETWFACCSQRIDEMRAIEDQLTQELLAVCDTKLAAARLELSELETLQAALSESNSSQGADCQRFFDNDNEQWAHAPHQPLQSQLDRSILELVQAQSLRLQAMNAELDTVRASLSERKLIERAKGLLMAHRKLSEEAAHKMMRQMAMNQNRRLVDVAEAVLAMGDMLSPQ